MKGIFKVLKNLCFVYIKVCIIINYIREEDILKIILVFGFLYLGDLRLIVILREIFGNFFMFLVLIFYF